MRLLLALLVGLLPQAASAYAFMIRHEYTTCAQCHVDPAGGSVLTAYGRAQGEVLLRTRYGASSEEDVGRVAGFLFGLLSPPEEVFLGGDVRGAFFSGADFAGPRLFPMQADVVGAVRSGKLVASVSIGLGSPATTAAKVFGDKVQLISRHHWAGYSPDEDQAFLVRFGRMSLPFGLRVPEHTSWVRAATRTDTNVSQQHGLSFSYSGEKVRTEVMGILGNLQVSPMEFRERGYSGFFEYSPSAAFALGVSSLITHADRDVLEAERSVWRHAHGLFARLTPWKPLVLSAEANVLHLSRSRAGGEFGVAALLQLDVEPIQGLHFVGVGEAYRPPFAETVGWGAWGGVWWFFAPHADVRVDLVTRQEPGSSTPGVSLLAQLHLFL
jgi:hypothetical protein